MASCKQFAFEVEKVYSRWWLYCLNSICLFCLSTKKKTQNITWYVMDLQKRCVKLSLLFNFCKCWTVSLFLLLAGGPNTTVPYTIRMLFYTLPVVTSRLHSLLYILRLALTLTLWAQLSSLWSSLLPFHGAYLCVWIMKSTRSAIWGRKWRFR